MSNFSKRIKQAIDDSRLSYGDLSKITGIPKSALQRYATGETEKIPLDRLELIAEATKVNAAYLLGWTENSSCLELNNGAGNEINQMAKNGIALIGNGNHVSYQGAVGELSSQTYDLVRIYNILSPKRQIKLMSLAYELEEEEKPN